MAKLFCILVVFTVFAAVLVESKIVSATSKNTQNNVKIAIEITGLDGGVGENDFNACNATCKRDCDIACGLLPTCRYLCYIAQCGCPGLSEQPKSGTVTSSNEINAETKNGDNQTFYCSEICFKTCMTPCDPTNMSCKQTCKNKCCFVKPKWY